MYIFKLSLLLLLGAVVYRLIQSRLRRRRLRLKAAELGCEPAPVFRLTNWLGIPAKKGKQDASKQID